MIRRRGVCPLIVDANVLIDFVDTDRSVFQLLAIHVGPVHVINELIREVDGIEDENEAHDLGLLVIEPEIEDAFTAVRGTGSLSFEDKLCMLTAKRHGFTCVTNDKYLRKTCRDEEVPALWGLETLAFLHKAGGISTSDVKRLARNIQKSNPFYISKKIVTKFMKIFERQARFRD